VISQNPASGTSVASGSGVAISVSTGPGNVTVPNVVGLTQAAATTSITGTGLVLGTVTTASSSSVPAGNVISQNPASGTSVTSGSAVAIAVSTGPANATVPNVVGLTQAAGTTSITGAGLVLGTVTMASSSSVPAGNVISQNPASGTSVASGSQVNLVVSSGAAPLGITVDASSSSDGTGTRTAMLTTTGTNRLVLAFGASDGPGSGTAQTLTVSGGGLTWSLVRRVNTRQGSSDIWQAFSSGVISNASISLAQSRTGYHQSLTVVAFAGATAVGASNTGNGASGQPGVNLTTTRAGAVIYGVGNDWDRAVARTVPTDQTKLHEWVDTAAGDTFWVQARIGTVPTVGTLITLNDTAPTNDRWNFAIVEIVP
jgi:hypothetical protein